MSMEDLKCFNDGTKLTFEARQLRKGRTTPYQRDQEHVTNKAMDNFRDCIRRITNEKVRADLVKAFSDVFDSCGSPSTPCEASPATAPDAPDTTVVNNNDANNSADAEAVAPVANIPVADKPSYGT